MKKSILILSYTLITLITFGQTDASNNTSRLNKKLPPKNMLPQNPGEVKKIYELPKVCDFKIFDEKGALVEQKTEEFIDYTNYKLGRYFIRYESKTETFSQTDTSTKTSPMSKKLPPMSMLKKHEGEESRIYELPKVCEYEILNDEGKLIENKSGEFIDFTSYKKGSYYVIYENKIEMFKKE